MGQQKQRRNDAKLNANKKCVIVALGALDRPGRWLSCQCYALPFFYSETENGSPFSDTARVFSSSSGLPNNRVVVARCLFGGSRAAFRFFLHNEIRYMDVVYRHCATAAVVGGALCTPATVDWALRGSLEVVDPRDCD